MGLRAYMFAGGNYPAGSFDGRVVLLIERLCVGCEESESECECIGEPPC
jgi:hypothetical protein